MYISINTINSIDNIIFNNSKIKYLEKLFNSEYTEILLSNSDSKSEINNDTDEEDNNEDNDYQPIYIEMINNLSVHDDFTKRNENIDSIV